jgi:hypothetical protein
MTAAEKTASVVQKVNMPSTGKTGTPMRLVKYIFKVTKANDGDWIVTADAFGETAAPILYNAVTIDGSSDGVQEGTVGLTYTHSGTKLTLSGGTTGTTYGEVWYSK